MAAAAGEQNIIRLDRDFRWPGGKRVAVIFNIAYEAWSDGQAPGIGPMGNVLKPGFFDTNAHSWATFGAVRGIQRLLDIVDRQGVKASVMTNGVLAERYPASIADIVKRGHELIAHSWGMDVIPAYFNEADEAKNIERTQQALSKAGGGVSRGWISPRGTGSLATPRLLAEAGFLHHGDCNDDDRPYVTEVAGRRIVGIPLTMDINDLPFCVRYGRSPGELIQTFEDTLKAYRERESVPLMLDVTAHTHVFGRPSGGWVYEAIVERVKRHDDVWICTRMEMAEHVLASVK
ncbi:MAG: polysaccharide deacetylase family protein [Betaproteobacteria bacterium]|nr:polysaccharide deacetylase family protein [Betaproteobacteria bacterium]